MIVHTCQNSKTPPTKKGKFAVCKLNLSTSDKKRFPEDRIRDW